MNGVVDLLLKALVATSSDVGPCRITSDLKLRHFPRLADHPERGH